MERKVTLDTIDAKIGNVVDVVSKIERDINVMKKSDMRKTVKIALLRKRVFDLEKKDADQKIENDNIWKKIRSLNLTRTSWVSYGAGALAVFGFLAWIFEHLGKRGGL